MTVSEIRKEAVRFIRFATTVPEPDLRKAIESAGRKKPNRRTGLTTQEEIFALLDSVNAVMKIVIDSTQKKQTKEKVLQ